ncbi:unnamed protein product [Linum tenue]|uniref:O-methyltransferase C-terminal domain-containing protein n=1 Tax=Linum tenue TaxID=586396 RepID=A0AAV0MEJ1_9ROSI|nr:unnamed protein product [Linum tenue]
MGLQWILHDWSDERCLKLLENCYKAIPKEGKVIVLEAVVPFMAENSTCSQLSTALDVFMMTQNPGGKERTKEEFLDLATRSGFRGIDFKYCVYNFWVMEFFK